MLSAEQKGKIRLYLGYPNLYRYKNTRLESALEGSVDADAEAVIVGLLAKIDQVEEQLLNLTLTTAGVRRVDEIWFFENNQQAKSLGALGRTYIGRISIILGTPIYSDYYGAQGYLGDRFSEGGLGSPAANGGTRGGGPIGLG